MRFQSSALPLSLLPAVLGAPAESQALHNRAGAAAPDSPSGNYAPTVVTCPAQRPAVRKASEVSPQEKSWLEVRRPNTIKSMMEFYQLADIPGFDAISFIESNKGNLENIPNIAIAMSGGGNRALLNGGGFLAAADSRVEGSTSSGGIGGLLQAATYLSGNSGGGWLVGSIYANNFTTITSLRDGEPGSGLWQLSSPISEGPAVFAGSTPGTFVVNATQYWDDIQAQISLKQAAGFNISLADYWGRALSYVLINAAQGGPAYTFSSVADASNFVSGDIPMPIIVSDELEPGQAAVTLTSTVYEFNPFELGSWGPTIGGFIPIKFAGSSFDNGVIPDGADCVEGFDQYGMIVGSSSFLFNELPGLFVAGESGGAPPNVAAILEEIDEAPFGEVARWEPNPFFGFNPSGNPSADSEVLSLVDGGEDFENLPLLPLLQPARAVDVIVAIDSSADTNFNYPNGSALRNTFERAKLHNGSIELPMIPDADTFINLGLNHRPTFFGCNTSDFSAGSIPPLLVYIALAPYSTFNNASTLQLSFTDEQRDSFIQNGFNVGTMGNGTVESEWPTCLACATLSRSLERAGEALPEACKSCFDMHCYNGTIDSTPATYNPTLIL
ncbi:lysophospholipase catalytic domain-containing protein [Xylaria sp. CBS 124048]|nr:lysophospholipase catalytic domain-containing protein [Xylaria sp. CBS 124048]